MGFRWLAEHCPGVKLVVKLDDDVILNVFKMVRYIIPTFRGKSREILCNLAKAGPIVRNSSNVEYGGAKWVVDKSDFKGLDRYPFPYCRGFFVFISGDLIVPLSQAAKVNPEFWIDDVYLYGMLPKTVADVTMTLVWKFVSHDIRYDTLCVKNRGTRCNSLIFHNSNMNRTDNRHMYDLWALLKSRVTEWDREQYHLHTSF